MLLPILNFNKVSQLLREDLSFCILERDIPITSMQPVLYDFIARIDAESDQSALYEVTVSEYLSPYTYKVRRNSEIIYFLKLLLHVLNQDFKCSLAEYKLNVLSPRGDDPEFYFKPFEGNRTHEADIKEVLQAEPALVEKLSTFCKSHFSKFIFSFEV